MDGGPRAQRLAQEPLPVRLQRDVQAGAAAGVPKAQPDPRKPFRLRPARPQDRPGDRTAARGARLLPSCARCSRSRRNIVAVHTMATELARMGVPEALRTRVM